jgi:hypothetical protein
MSSWYYKVTGDISKIPDFIIHFETELEAARFELSLKGKTLEKHAAELPGIVEHRYVQLQEIEAVLEYLNIQLRKDRSAEFKKFLEAYNKTLSSRDAEKYVDGVASIVDSTLLINEVALLRNKYLGISKALEQKSFSSSNIIKLRTAGLDDASV